MQNPSNDYNLYVIKSILINNQFDITEVFNLESIKHRSFLSTEYQSIKQLIKDGKIEEIKNLSGFTPNSEFPREYLDIMTFNDQSKKGYIVTIYDSDELLQDPRIIEIFPSR